MVLFRSWLVKTIACGLFDTAFMWWVSIMYVRSIADGKCLPHVRVNAWDSWQILVIAFAVFLFGCWLFWLTINQSFDEPIKP